MAESVQETERKLKKLGEKIRAGWDARHPAKQGLRDAVQAALLAKWRQEEAPAQKDKSEEKISELEKLRRKHRQEK